MISPTIMLVSQRSNVISVQRTFDWGGGK